MHVTVREILHRPGLRLQSVVDPGPRALDAAVTWVTSSDLADPAPFLDRGNLLLTTGRQFDPPAGNATCTQRYTDDAQAYVSGLRRQGVSAVGFGTRVLHAGTPTSLVEACHRHELPLFEVPYDVPFIAVIRAAADLIDAAGHRRAAWALTATRAISAAVLRTPPIDSVLGELSRQLSRGVILVDSRGRIRAVHGMPATNPIVSAARQEAMALLRRGRHTGATVTVPHPPPTRSRPHTPEPQTPGAGSALTHLTMQTVGSDAELRTVLVLAGSSGVDSAEQTVLAGAVALLWRALGERTDNGTERATLQRVLWRLLVGGDCDLVRGEAPIAGMRLAPEPVRAAAWSTGPPEAVEQGLRKACEDGLDVVFATVDGVVLACVGADDVEVLGMIDPSRGVGVSEPVPYAQLAGAVDRARRAAVRARAGTVVRLDDPEVGGLTALFTEPDMIDRARCMLRRLDEHDAATRSGLVEALGAWLRENGNYEAAARRLGLHRHTLTARVTRASALVERDLNDVDVRTDLWLALRLTGRV